MVRLPPLACIASETAPKEAFSGRQRDIRVRLLPELSKRADGKPQVLERGRGDAIANERHTLERDLDQRRKTLCLQVPERWRTSARRTGLGRDEIRSGAGRRCQARPRIVKLPDK